jgi:hypothetical protein
LSEAEATAAVDATFSKIDNFLGNCGKSFTKEDLIFLQCSLKVSDPFAYFYILAKVHKSPWKTCPVSITHRLGRWLDQQLQPICQKLPAYLKSSVELKQKLNALTYDPSNTRFFTADTVSMYTNIDTDHALSMISAFLQTSPLCADVPNAELIIHALELIMRRNYFSSAILTGCSSLEQPWVVHPQLQCMTR